MVTLGGHGIGEWLFCGIIWLVRIRGSGARLAASISFLINSGSPKSIYGKYLPVSLLYFFFLTRIMHLLLNSLSHALLKATLLLYVRVVGV